MLMFLFSKGISQTLYIIHYIKLQDYICFQTASESHHGDHTARSDTVTETSRALTVGVVPPSQEILLAHIIWMFVHHEAPVLYPDGVTLGKVWVQVCTVTAAFVIAALKVSILVENDLIKIKDTTLQ